MRGNRVCELFGIRYPIIQGGMLRISCPELTAAVSNAGGLGILHGVKSPEELRDEIQKTKELTDKPFAINLPMVFVKETAHDLAEVLVKEGVKVAATAAGSPEVCAKQLKDGGVAVMHVSATVAHAVKAEAAGVDAVVAEGVEAGGIMSQEEVTTLALVPQVADAVKIPIIAAGGIGDARGLIAALALGAEGIQMGTRFIATKECPVHPDYKQAVLKAIDTSSEINRSGKIRGRSFRANFLKEALPHSTASYGGGQVSGLIKDIPTVAELIDRIIREASLVNNRVKEALSAIS